jgi:ClpP class serine protease
MVMAADEILMDAASALGPIDAQIFWQGKVFSADALLEGFEKMGLQEVVWVEDGVPRSGKPHGARV